MLKKIAPYLFTAVGSILLVVLAVEVLLRGAGALFLFIQEEKNKRSLGQGMYRILCVGESTTALGGESSYPAQLERILNERSGSSRFKVINKGVPGLGSGYIAEHLKSWIDEHAPQMVIVMMGINDGSERIPVNELMRHGGGLRGFLVDLRIYKLCRWIYIGVKERFAGQKKGLELPVNDSAKGLDPKLVVLAELALREKEYVQAEKLFLYIAKQGNPLINWKARMRLHEIYFATDNIPALLGMIGKNPLEPVNIDVAMRLCKDHRYFSYVMDLLDGHSLKVKDKMPWHDLMGGCLSNQGLKDQAKVFFDLARQEELSGVGVFTQSNYLRMMEILDKKSVEVVVMQYPLRSLASLKLMLSDAVNHERIFFLGNESNFQKALMQVGYDALFTDRFAGDFGHCTPEGNRLIASNLADLILEKVLKTALK